MSKLLFDGGWKCCPHCGAHEAFANGQFNVWLIEISGDYYRDTEMVGIAPSEQEAKRMIEEYNRDYSVWGERIWARKYTMNVLDQGY